MTEPYDPDSLAHNDHWSEGLEELAKSLAAEVIAEEYPDAGPAERRDLIDALLAKWGF